MNKKVINSLTGYISDTLFLFTDAGGDIMYLRDWDEIREVIKESIRRFMKGDREVSREYYYELLCKVRNNEKEK